MAVNCSALSENLLESELFGYERGSFTGADRRKLGKFEIADGGTLFLDEVATITPAMQVKLLNVLQERAFQRVGGERDIEVDVRILAATNMDLATLTANGMFRNDLYYRLNVFPIEIPPLRDRREDIPLLVELFLDRLRGLYAKEIHAAHSVVMDAFLNYPWPGNVRELENLIERMMILCPNDVIRVTDLPQGFKDNIHNALHLEGIPAEAKLYETLAMIEQAMIERALKMSDNVQAHAAALLGIGKSGLNQKIKKYNLEVGSKH